MGAMWELLEPMFPVPFWYVRPQTQYDDSMTNKCLLVCVN